MVECQRKAIGDMEKQKNFEKLPRFHTQLTANHGDMAATALQVGLTYVDQTGVERPVNFTMAEKRTIGPLQPERSVQSSRSQYGLRDGETLAINGVDRTSVIRTVVPSIDSPTQTTRFLLKRSNQ